VRDAELALVAEIRELAQVGPKQPMGFSVHFRAIQGPEEDIEGGTEVVAAAAGVADVRHPPHFCIRGSQVVKVVRRRIEQSSSVLPTTDY
jgi:hypothetical protein